MSTTHLFLALLLSALLASCSSETTKTLPAYQTRFVTVADSVRLEVLDWGGTGQPLLFLTGLGNSAHVYVDFAPRFTDHYHVYEITRRGFGRSSRPKTGYDVPTLAHDVLVVLDSLHIDQVYLVGHSIAGDEMTTFASSYPDQVAKLVYLDAAYDHSSTQRYLQQLDKIAKQPARPKPTARDTASLAGFSRYFQRNSGGMVMPAEELKATSSFAKDGHYQGHATPGFVFDAIRKNLSLPNYQHIHCPALAIYVHWTTVQQWAPYYSSLDSSARRQLDRAGPSVIKFINKRTQENESMFRKEVARGVVKEMKGADHYLFLSHPAQTEHLMRAFLH